MTDKDVKALVAKGNIFKDEPPQPLRRQIRKSIEFPIMSLPVLLRETVMSLHKKLQVSIPICAQSILATVNLAVQGHANIMMPWGHIKPISCYFLTIAKSGERKTACDDDATSNIRLYQDRLQNNYELDIKYWRQNYAVWKNKQDNIIKSIKYPEWKEKQQALQAIGDEPVKPLLPNIICKEPTIEGLYKLLKEGQASIGLFSSESGQFFGGFSMQKDNKIRTSSSLSDIWDGGAIERIRGGDDISIIKNKRLAMHLLVQPEVVKDFLQDKKLKEQGILSRMLISYPPSIKGIRDDTTYNKENIKSFHENITNTLNTPLITFGIRRNQLSPRAITLLMIWISFAVNTLGILILNQ